MKRLRIPVALGFAVVGATAATVLLGGSCGSSKPPIDAAACELFCISNGTDAGVCPEPIQCADAGAVCPPGCEPIG